jgi:hypothetical protein
MTVAKLERKTITKLPATDGVWWDDSLKGFGYLQRTDASGALRKSFVLQYRFGKIQRKIKLGDASKLNVDQARKIALKLFGEILNGVEGCPRGAGSEGTVGFARRREQPPESAG